MKTVMTLFGAFALAFLLILLFTYPVMLLWNSCLVPAIETFNPITFWQSLGILVLINVLFNTTTPKTKKDE